MRAARSWLLPGLGALLAAVALGALLVGAYAVPASALGALVLRKLHLGEGLGCSAQQEAVLWSVRLPRVVLGALVGGALGAAGAAMQGVFRNPLADPGLCGVSSGAALGAVGVIVLGARGLGAVAATAWGVPAAAFVGGLLATGLVVRLGRVGGGTPVAALLLAGVAVNAMAGAGVGVLTFLATDPQLRTLTFWSLGSLGGATWPVVLAVAPWLLVPVLWLPRSSRALDALLLGEGEASALGFEVDRVKRRLLVLVALAVGAAVAVAGVVGFVGLVVPSWLRMIVGPGHRRVLPGAALAGATLLLGADAVARTLVAPAELPLGVVTAAIGSPFFVALLLRERRRLGA